MEVFLQAAWEGWVLVFSWPNILYPVAGTLLAMFFSAMPGLSGVTLMALAIPFTFSWDLLHVMLIFGAFVGGATFMGSVTAILFNIPGKNSSVAVLLDGYPMTRTGEARTALGCSAAASALGSTVGILVLIFLLPVLRRILLVFGPPELLMLAVWGLTALAVLTRGSVVKGLICAGIGLLLASIGYDPRTAEARFTFGSQYLQDGLSLVPIFLGIFALAEVVRLGVSGRTTLSGLHSQDQLSGSLARGVGAVFKNFGLFLRSSFIGTVVGMIPGIGGTVASFIAYGHAVNSSPGEKIPFGKGNVRGVLAPEAAVDAKDGGALLPALGLGIPGGSGTALLLAALTVHGVSPGRAMLGDHLSLVFVLIWSLFLSNWLTSLLGLAVVNPLARLTTVRLQLLMPVILVLATLGAYSYRGDIRDVFAAYAFGGAGYLMRKFDWPRIPLVMGIVLGPLFEANLHLTVKLHSLGRIHFWSRPVVIVLIVLSLAGIVLPVLQTLLSRKGGG